MSRQPHAWAWADFTSQTQFLHLLNGNAKTLGRAHWGSVGGAAAEVSRICSLKVHQLHFQSLCSRTLKALGGCFVEPRLRRVLGPLTRVHPYWTHLAEGISIRANFCHPPDATLSAPWPSDLITIPRQSYKLGAILQSHTQGHFCSAQSAKAIVWLGRPYMAEYEVDSQTR